MTGVGIELSQTLVWTACLKALQYVLALKIMIIFMALLLAGPPFGGFFACESPLLSSVLESNIRKTPHRSGYTSNLQRNSTFKRFKKKNCTSIYAYLNSNTDRCWMFKENQTPLKCKMQYFTSRGNLNIKGFSVAKYIEVGFLEVLGSKQ